MKEFIVKHQKYLNYFAVILGIAAFILVWEITSIIVNEPNVFPTFSTTLVNTFDVLGNQDIYISILYSLGISLGSILISTIIAIVVGTISGLFKFIEKFLSPFVTFFKIIPTACIVILLIIFSKDLISYFLIVFLIVFPIIYEAVVKGFNSIDSNIILSLRVEGLYKPRSIIKVMFPMVSSHLNGALASAIGIGIKVEIMSEILVGSDSIHGLGYLIYLVRNVTFNYVDLYSYIILIAVIFLIIDLIIYFLKKIKIN